jgi:hypothetical protein
MHIDSHLEHSLFPWCGIAYVLGVIHAWYIVFVYNDIDGYTDLEAPEEVVAARVVLAAPHPHDHHYRPEYVHQHLVSEPREEPLPPYSDVASGSKGGQAKSN